MKIKILNFGPIKDSGWIDISKLSVFIGEQGSGKSTIAKLISIFLWLEKDLFRSDGESDRYRRWSSFFNKCLEYHRIKAYLSENSYIEYLGLSYEIIFSKEASDSNNIIKFKKLKTYNEYKIPKITYFPSERNIVSSIKKSKYDMNLKLYSESLQDFKDIFQEAKNALKNKECIELPIDSSKLEYDSLNSTLFVKGVDYSINLTDASSGFQSISPLIVVLRYVKSLINKPNELTDVQRKVIKKRIEKLRETDLDENQVQMIISTLYSSLNINSTFNIIEEPEQNLFPSTQKRLLYKLLEYNNVSQNNKLILTTHSPYIIGYISLAIKANHVGKDAKDIIPVESHISSEDVNVYELDSGLVRKIDMTDGILSDDDFLNKFLIDINDDFDRLLEIQ